MIQYDKLGIFLSKPIAFLLVVIYLVQSVLLVYLVRDKFDLERGHVVTVSDERDAQHHA